MIRPLDGLSFPVLGEKSSKRKGTDAHLHRMQGEEGQSEAEHLVLLFYADDFYAGSQGMEEWKYDIHSFSLQMASSDAIKPAGCRAGRGMCQCCQPQAGSQRDL